MFLVTVDQSCTSAWRNFSPYLQREHLQSRDSDEFNCSHDVSLGLKSRVGPEQSKAFILFFFNHPLVGGRVCLESFSSLKDPLPLEIHRQMSWKFPLQVVGCSKTDPNHNATTSMFHEWDEGFFFFPFLSGIQCLSFSKHNTSHLKQQINVYFGLTHPRFFFLTDIWSVHMIFSKL